MNGTNQQGGTNQNHVQDPNHNIPYKPEQKHFLEKYGTIVVASITILGSLVGVYIGINSQIASLNSKIELYHRDVQYLRESVNDNTANINNINQKLGEISNTMSEERFELKHNLSNIENQLFNSIQRLNGEVRNLKDKE